LISSPNGGLGTATYAIGTIFNAPNLSVIKILKDSTFLKVEVSVTKPQPVLFWKGGLVDRENVWAATNGMDSSNWASTAGGEAQAAVPTSITAVTLSGTNASNQNPMVLGTDMTIQSLTITDPNAIVLAGGN